MPFSELGLSGWVPLRALTLSIALHVAAFEMPLPAFRVPTAVEAEPRTVRIEYDVRWTQPRRLPPIAPRLRRRAKSRRRAPKRRSPPPAARPYQPQTIISNPPEPDHPTQTLLTKLDAAPAQLGDIRLPNMVIPSAPEVALKPVVRSAPAQEFASLPRLPSPGEIMMAETKLEKLRPRLPVRPGNPAGVSAPEIGGPRVTREAVGVPGGVVALSASPAAPAPRLEIPQARIKAQFAAGPQSGDGPPGLGGTGAPTGINLSDIDVSGGSIVGARDPAIVGPPPPPATPPVPQSPPQRSREDRIRELLAAAEGGAGNVRVFTTYLYLANLTAQSSSWLLRFSEHEAGNSEAAITAPVVVRKVDPCYPPGLFTERVEGTVWLYGVIGTDGAVRDVTVVRATEDRLAERAAKALAQSRFQPSRRQGQPIAIDALVEIPFRLVLCF